MKLVIIKTLVLISFLMSVNVDAVIIRADIIPISNGRKIIALAEWHDPMPSIDIKQLAAVTRFLQRRHAAQKNVHVLVEVPCLLAQHACGTNKVTTGIISKVLKLSSYISAEDIEIRCISRAADHLLTAPSLSQFDPNEIINANLRWCRVGDITFKDLFKEYEQLYVELCGSSSLQRFHYLGTMSRAFAFHKYEENLKQITVLKSALDNQMKYLKIDLKDKIFDVAISLSLTEEGLEQRSQLNQCINHLFWKLFELKIAQQLDLYTQKNDKADILLIAGCAHINAFNKFFDPTQVDTHIFFNRLT